MPLTTEAPECAHCGLPVPAGLVHAEQTLQFCCRGCSTAHALIHAHGLQGYYALPDRTGAAAATGDRRLRYAELDRPAFVAAHVTTHAGGECSSTLGIDGIHCAACIWLLERLPRVVPGVIEARVDWRQATIRVRWSAGQVSLSQIAEGIAGLGYRPHPLRAEPQAARYQAEDRQRLIAIGVAFAAAGNNMLIAGSLYLGLFSYIDDPTTHLLRWGSCAVGMVSLLWPGRVFFRGAWSALRSRTPHMDLPVALGLSVGGLAGLVNTIRGHGALYFDTLSVLVFLLLVGRFIQLHQQRRAAAALDVLYRITPAVAHKLVEGGFAEVPAQVLQPGDIVRVAAGETIPGDGTVLAGDGAVDEKVLTGEASPRTVACGSKVAAGTVNLGSLLQLRVDAVGAQTRMGRVLALVEGSAAARPAIVALADRMGGWFVVSILGFSLATLVAWLAVEPALAVDHAVALLIVACPCALALATPLALAVVLGRAARRGILIKGGDVLQRLSEPGTIWLDKTGTLTEGRMSVVDVRGDRSIARWMSALQAHSSHPVAHALSRWAGPSAPGLVVREVEHSRRGGIAGSIDGRAVAVGNGRFVGEHLLGAARPALRRAATELLGAGASPVFVAIDGELVAVAGVGDPLRADAPGALAELQRRGWTVGILSGDHPDVVRRVGASLGLPEGRCHGGLLPEDKVHHVTAGGDRRPTVMVGDGINDSAALAAASVGIAVHDGAEASLHAAAVYLSRPGLSGIIELLGASRAAMRGIVRNFAVSLAYNAVAVALAAAGLVSPLLAAILMPISSLSVVGLSLAIRFNEVSS